LVSRSSKVWVTYQLAQVQGQVQGQVQEQVQVQVQVQVSSW
jgi:hypothetical protein